MNPIVLTGLDGSNPLAFLAALGVLVALDEAHDGEDATRPRLSWQLDGVWRPVLHSLHADLGAVVAVLDADRVARAADPAITFTYPGKPKDGVSKPVPDLKPPPGLLRSTLSTWVAEASPGQRHTVDWFTGFLSEGAVAVTTGDAKPTALHFTAGQQQFLGAVLQLAEGCSVDSLWEALAGPWAYASKLPVMGWDNTEARDYALRATAPTGDKKLGNPGADWLAVRGLALLPTAARRGEQRTPGVSGSWKHGTFTWPLWTRPLGRSVAGALLTDSALVEMGGAARSRRGVQAVMRVRILRAENGGRGSVTPSEPV